MTADETIHTTGTRSGENIVDMHRHPARQRRRGSGPPHEDTRLRQVLTAMAGLDALELELLIASPSSAPSAPSAPGAHASALAATQEAHASRDRLHAAYPHLAMLDPIEILHVMATMAVSAVPPARSTMPGQHHNPGPMRWFRRGRKMVFKTARLTWGILSGMRRRPAHAHRGPN